MSELTNEHIQLIQRGQRWKMAFLGMVILVAGIVIGVGSTLILRPSTKETAPRGIEFINERIIRNVQAELHLNENQAQKVDAILKKHLNKLHEIREQARPKMAEIMNDLYAEVLTVLDEPQKKQWETSIKHISEKFTRSGHGGRGRRSGGQMGPGGRGPGGGFGDPSGRGSGSIRGSGAGRNWSHRPFGSWGPPINPDDPNAPKPRWRNSRSRPQSPDKSSIDSNSNPAPEERK